MAMVDTALRMTSLTAARLRIGEWCVDPNKGEISRLGQIIRVEARTMRLMVRLAEHSGEVVSIDELLDHVWSGVIVTPDSVYQTVASLRRLLGDDSKRPIYIATVPRMGYRMVAAVSPWVDAPSAAAAGPPVAGYSAARAANLRAVSFIAAGGALGLAFLVGAVIQSRTAQGSGATSAAVAAASAKSVAVLPFRDMTPTMDQEILADDLTEDLIDKLSKVPGVRTSPPGSSFSFKGRRLGAAEAARILGVAFVLDGSVRKSGATVQIVVRLVGATNGFVVWSETYVRPAGEIPAVQDEIASKVGKAMRESVDGAAGSPQTTRSP